MTNIDSILAHGIPFLMVLTRITGLFLFTPLVTSTTIPTVYKALLSFMFAVAIYPFVPLATLPETIDLISLAPMLMTELLIGVIIGLIAGIPMMAIQMGGYIMGYQMGLSLAQSFNPELDTNSSVIGQLLFFLSIFIYISVGGFETIFMILADSFHTIGSGTFSVGDTPLELLLNVLNTGFELAIRVASPIMGVVSMLMIAMGFIMKTMPQINIMSVGFSIQILAGLSILALLIASVGLIAGDEMVHVLELINSWVQSFAMIGVRHG
ncbi:MAG: flagellar biosynthetic protein FliR [Phycisphaerales bacterium]|nr:flagellar biosynthetic protein FliR [Phycisphaerales bacterium]